MLDKSNFPTDRLPRRGVPEGVSTTRTWRLNVRHGNQPSTLRKRYVWNTCGLVAFTFLYD